MTVPVAVSIGDQVYAEGSEEAFGSVRHIQAHDLIVDIENHGDVAVEAVAIHSVHDGKVIVNVGALQPHVQRAIKRAHSAEDR